MVHTRVEVHRIDLWNDLGFSLCAAPSVCNMITTSGDRKMSKMEVSADWCISQIRYLLVVILELNSVSEVQYKGMMTDR